MNNTTDFKIGLVGLTNVGKTTIYNLLTSSNSTVQKYPFTTIDTNTNKLISRDENVESLFKHFEIESKTHLERKKIFLCDVAGLVRDSSKGNGLGNLFLNHFNKCDVIIHVVRNFECEEVTNTEDNIDPVRDIRIVETELVSFDISQLTKEINRSSNQKKETLLKFKKYLAEKNHPMRLGEWNDEELLIIKELNLLTMKPEIFLINVSEKDLTNTNDEKLIEIQDYVEKTTKDPIITFCPIQEQKFVNLGNEKEEMKEFTSKIPEFISTILSTMGLITVYLHCEEFVESYKIPVGTSLGKVAGLIHKMFEEKFLSANVYNIKDLNEYHDLNLIKENGRYFKKGKNEYAEDGDIITFNFSTEENSNN
ncbi:obg gtpase family [Anaeramoeba flamelloides]|uniref:Obg gtpase family n=1 Tax=Anaeramoeba flamelloides TaxID=1746091 RepID=A0ABQ8XGH9_9EUKA|nr:obg gtpase family [Anaeramoeba flamelloides]